MSLDIVIPLAKSKTDFLDLRYVLRSIERFTSPGRIFLVGEKPGWVQNIIHIPFEDQPGKQWKERNIYLKANEAFKYTDRYLFMNDDHVFLSFVSINNYPYYYKGTCQESMERNDSHYRATMNHTRKLLEQRGYPDLNFDGHCPIIFHKDHFESSVTSANWGVHFGYGLKSLYAAAMYGVQHLQDVKISTKMPLKEVEKRFEGRHVVSFTDAGLVSGVGEYLQHKFPNKSKYERR